MKKLRFKAINIITYTLLTFSVLIFAGTFYFISNIKVIEDWKLTLPNQEIHVGDTIVVASTYHKLRDVSGESIRYIECKNRTGIWIRYELNRATPNRAAGKGGTGIVLTLRRDIPDVPTQCKITIAIRYDVLPLRQVNVSNSSKEFTLLAERTLASSSSTEPPVATQNNLSPEVPVYQYVIPVMSSSSNTTVSPAEQQPNNSQVATETPTVQPPVSTSPPEPSPNQSSLLQHAVNVVQGTVQGLTKLIL